MEGDQSVLLMFDPLTSPRQRKTPQTRRDLDPTSPVAAFLNSVDKSKNLLETVRKHNHGDLINLDQPQSSLDVIQEHVEQATLMATPLPTFKLTLDNPNRPTMDPFSPATYATPTNTLLVFDTPAKADLSMSTNFTPVPASLPSLLNASFSSLRTSGTSSVTSSARRRRSSIDLDKELDIKSPDSSFDILRGELEIGNSADASFITADDSLRTMDAESPWTIRTSITASGYKLGSSLLPVKELRESSLLAHEIPLPESPPTSPESSDGHNEDASIHASKVFSHTRRFSMASALQFPTEGPSPPRSPGKLHQFRANTARKPMVHVRTTSMSSISSASSSRSGITIKGTSPSKRSVPTSPSKGVPAPALPMTKRLPRPSIVGKPPTATAGKPRMSMVAPRASIVPSAPVRKLGVGTAPRSSIAPRSSLAPVRPRTSVASSIGTMAPPPVPGAPGAIRRAPRASVQPTITARTGMKPPPARAPRASIVPSTTTPTTINAPTHASKQGNTPTHASKQGNTVLAPSIRANSTMAQVQMRTARPSLIGGTGVGALRKAVSTASGLGKAAPTNVAPLIQAPVKEPITSARTQDQMQGQIRRPRTSSAGAALISRPEYARTHVAAAGLIRPKSSMRV